MRNIHIYPQTHICYQPKYPITHIHSFKTGDEARQIYMQVPRPGRYLGRQRRSIDEADSQTDSEGQAIADEATVDAQGEEHHQSKRAALPRFGMQLRDIPLPRLGMYERAALPRLGMYERAALPRLGKIGFCIFIIQKVGFVLI